MSLPDTQLAQLPPIDGNTSPISISYRALPATPNPQLPTILFFHPFITDTSFFEPQFNDPALYNEAGKKWNIIAIDIHGHGGTVGREQQAYGFQFWDTAKDTIALLQLFDITKNVHIMGTSQGGFIALRISLLQPSLVSNIILAGSTALSESPESRAAIAELTTNFPNVPENLQKVVQASFGIDYKAEGATQREREAGQKWVDCWMERYAEGPGQDRFRLCVAQLLERDDITDRLGEVKANVYVAHGSNDLIYSVEAHAVKTKELLEKAGVLKGYEVLDGGAHYLSWGKWEDVNRMLIKIVQESS